MICVLFAGRSIATPYVSPEAIREEYVCRQNEKLARGIVESERAIGYISEGSRRLFDYDYPYHFDLEAEFITTLQVDDPGNPDDGGMREGEHLPDIIQSDNTQESIWVWCRYQELHGDDRYNENIEDAWGYVMRFPAYSEEGGSGPLGYYRVYNCGWGLQAEMIYRDVFADTTYKSYADSICGYLDENRLNLYYPVPPYRLLNGMVQGWAVGGLYDYAVREGNDEYRAISLDIAADVKEWIEDEPETFLSEEVWAMSGGAAVWGVINSYFREYPEELPDWIAQYGPLLDSYEEYGEWHNAWNGWYALGHYTLWCGSGEMPYKGYHRALTDILVGQDGDEDGGIPVSEGEPDDQDQSWVSNYLAFMCLEPLRPAVDLLLVDTPTTLSRGDHWSYRALMVSNRGWDLSFYGGSLLFLPDHTPYHGNPFYGPEKIILGPYEYEERLLEGTVPHFAPIGDYRVDFILGNPPRSVIDREQFLCRIQ
jgi:hypothetical protein